MKAYDDPARELHLLVGSRHGVVWVDEADEERIERLLDETSARYGYAVWRWHPLHGLRRGDAARGMYGTEPAVMALRQVAALSGPALFVFERPEALLGDANAVEQAVDTARTLAARRQALVLPGEDLTLPPRLAQEAARLRLPPPTARDYRRLIGQVYRDVSATQHIEVALTAEQLEQLIANLRGLTLQEATRVVTRVMIEDGRLGPDDIRRVIEAKRQIVEREGLLEYYPVEQSFAEVADLRNLKQWLAVRQAAMRHRQAVERTNLPFPRGILLVGVPGTGKSLCAKAVATQWRLPLLRLDPARLYDKYVGETESKFHRAFRTAERVAPVVLWIDEIEKALAPQAGEADGGLSTRVLGLFLTWLQERQGDIFVVATANDVTRLPPELVRKGRFDEIFFVDLPDEATRRELFRIHLRRHGQDPAAFDLDALAAHSAEFSGSDIEQVVVSALHTCVGGGATLDTAALLAEIAHTQPLARLMPERIAALRDWARGRTTPAN